MKGLEITVLTKMQMRRLHLLALLCREPGWTIEVTIQSSMDDGPYVRVEAWHMPSERRMRVGPDWSSRC
jgi:hypothetical protein